MYIIFRRYFSHEVVTHYRQLLHDIHPDLGYLVEELEDEDAAYDAEEGECCCAIFIDGTLACVLWRFVN